MIDDQSIVVTGIICKSEFYSLYVNCKCCQMPNELTPCQGSLRTGSVFRAIARYLKTHCPPLFQFENVVSLATKPKKDNSIEIGPSNLSAVSAILRHEAGMWSHTWQVDSHRDFGSGQQRHRLWGIAFQLQDLHMTEHAATGILDTAMNSFAGVKPCHPTEYLLPESGDLLKRERHAQVAKSLGQEDLVAEHALDISRLFETGGVIPQTKRRKLRKTPSETSPAAHKWVKSHANAFRELGQDLPSGSATGSMFSFQNRRAIAAID